MWKRERKMNKQFKLILTITALVFCMGANKIYNAEASSIKISKPGYEVTLANKENAKIELSVPVINYDYAEYIPLELAEKWLGAEVVRTENNGEILAAVQIGKDSIVLETGKEDITKNGEIIQVKQGLIFINGEIYLSVRVFADIFDINAEIVHSAEGDEIILEEKDKESELPDFQTEEIDERFKESYEKLPRELISDDIKLYAQKELRTFRAPMEKTFDAILTIDERKALVNGEEKQIITEPVIRRNYTLIPFRAIADMFGAKVEWLKETKQVHLSYDGTELFLTVGEETALKNGESVKMDVAPQIINDYTMVPLRFVAESFLLNVDYLPDKRQVNLYKEQEQELDGVEGYNEWYKKKYLKEFNDGIVTPVNYKDIEALAELPELYAKEKATIGDYGFLVNLGFEFNYDEEGYLCGVTHYWSENKVFYKFKSDVIPNIYLYRANNRLDKLNKSLTFENGKEFSWEMKPEDYKPITDGVDVDNFLIFMDDLALTKAILVVNSIIDEPLVDENIEDIELYNRLYDERALPIMKKLHDYLLDTVSYDYNDECGFDNQYAYSAFLTGKTVCAGYAKAYKMLLDCCGIYNLYVTGVTTPYDPEENGHAWNVVSLNDEYYHIDVTWDDTGAGGRYEYFLLSDTEIAKDHHIDECDGAKNLWEENKGVNTPPNTKNYDISSLGIYR